MYGIIIISEGGACVCSSKGAPVPSRGGPCDSVALVTNVVPLNI